MKISIVFILIYVIDSSWCQDETVFHCSPKPGCKIAQCDPVDLGWDRPGFNIGKHLHDKEFPITCKSKNASQPKNTANLFSLVTRNILDIRTIKSELKQLEGNVDENRKKIDHFEQNMLDQKTNNEIQTQSDEVRSLRDKALLQSEQINDLVRRFAKQSVELNELKMKNVEQFTEISDLKKDLTEVQKMNKKLIDDNRQMKKDLVEVQGMKIKLINDNEKMEEAISRIEQKLAFTDKPHQLPSRSGQITRSTAKTRTTLKPTTKTRTTLKPSPAPENCKLKDGNICYFAVIEVKEIVNYEEAFDICKKQKADVGLIRDEEIYIAIVNYLRKNIPNGQAYITIWTGIHFDPMTRDVTPANSFPKWHPDFPPSGIKYTDRTNVYVYVNSKPSYYYQGMINAPPTWKRNGVICEILM